MSDDCKPDTGNSLNNNQQKNPLLSKTIFASKDNQSKANYKLCLSLIKNSKWVKNETFESFYNIARQTYNGLAEFSLNGGNDNISFSTYMAKKVSMVKDQSTPLGDGGQQADTSVLNRDGEYYLVGTFNDWGDNGNKEDYRLFVYNENGVERFVCNFQINYFFNSNEFKLKISEGSFSSWDENQAYGYAGNVDGVDYMKKAGNIASVKCPDAKEGMVVRFFITIETGAYNIYPLTAKQFRISVNYFKGNTGAILINDQNSIGISEVDTNQYTATFGPNMLDSENSFTLRFVCDIEGIGPYYFTAISDGSDGLMLVFDGRTHETAAYKNVVEGNHDSIKVSIDLFAGTVTYQAIDN